MTRYTYTFSLLAIDDSLAFDVASPNQQDVENFFFGYLSVFPGVLDFQNYRVISLTKNSEELKSNMRDFVASNPSVPQLNAVEAFIRKLREDEKFYVVPRLIALEESIKLLNYLQADEDGVKFEELNRQGDEMFGDFMQMYQISSFGEKRLVIGEKKKEDKVCRFCGEAYPKVSFEKKAHAISEGLGNKTLVLTEECDDCNWKFSQTIEPDLIDFFALYRTLYDIKGKGGLKDFKGKNFKFFKGDTLELHFQDSGENEESENGMPKVITLDSGRKIRRQNIYRTLVKFVLSVISKDELGHLQKTIDWINDKLSIAQLPKIAIFTFYDKLVKQPIIMVYKRKNQDTDYPYMVGEFHFAFMKYCFIIPAADKDEQSFVDKKEYEKFWKKFRHYDSFGNDAVFKEFSGDVEQKFTIKLNIEFPNDK
jgi:hypothetical protein